MLQLLYYVSTTWHSDRLCTKTRSNPQILAAAASDSLRIYWLDLNLGAKPGLHCGINLEVVSKLTE
jgi:hypothetical protein